MSLKVPFAYSKVFERIVSIDQVGSGRNNLYCKGCNMELVGRICKGERQNHFAHYSKDNKTEGAKVTCEYSYWVSVRDMAKQILNDASFINIPKLSLFTCKDIPVWVTKRDTSCDVRFKSVGFYFDIFLQTPESEEGRSNNQFLHISGDFYPKLVLNINLGEIPSDQIANPATFTKHLLSNKDIRKWIMPTSSFVKKKVLDKVVSRPVVSQIHITSREINEREEKRKRESAAGKREWNVLMTLEKAKIALHEFEQRELNTCARMPLYFEFAKEKFKHSEKKSDEVYIFNTGNSLYGLYVNGDILCIAKLNQEYIIYKGVDEVDITVFGVTDSIDDAIEFLEKGMHLEESCYSLVEKAEELLLFFKGSSLVLGCGLDEVVVLQEDKKIKIGVYNMQLFAVVSHAGEKGLYILTQEGTVTHAGNIQTEQEILGVLDYIIEKEAEDLF